ncbi:MAG TPA: dihydroorotate dehydrogenase electron transfer subunit [Candidatus Cloacimonetes bacterium]|nr:dihydroorotate dehydrogenase electron transfer subunit [Candidatus Cloacimonadota bacterium]HEX37955.1 dihydroorotate dehydrogenase electron transfer subunit [Candidatus Cloacimonadota bacterium]
MQLKKLPIQNISFLNQNYFELSFRDEKITELVKPGQFFQIKNPSKKFPLLPRPFSISKVEKDTFSFLIKKIGKVTRSLSELVQGEIVQLLGPLGNGFTLVDNKNSLLVSGGIGYAPMPFLEKELHGKGNHITSFHGGRTGNDIFCREVMNCTEDGSVGLSGFVTEHVEKYLQDNPVDVVYSCGPEPMLKVLVELCIKNSVQVQISMERIMACGVGACCGCVVSVEENNEVVYKKVCKDGPVFDGAKVVWDE